MEKNESKKLYLYPILILLIAFGTYFYHYYKPEAVFWDENYHVASAYKYLNGVMFMETHPPLGKLFIALGEWMLHPNTTLNTHYFLTTDYIKTFPRHFLFDGVRLFPTLFGVFGSVLFFYILYQISKNSDISFLFTSLYLFENGFILQSRAAMLESSQIFFLFFAIYYFLKLLDRENINWKNYLLFGLLVGFSVSIKLNSLILIILFPFLFFRYSYPNTLKLVKEFILNGISFVVGISIIWIAVFYIHFSLGTKVYKKYSASQEYLTIIKNHSEKNPLNFYIMMRDNIKYMANYNKKVPKYNPCKKGENGSLASTWPFMNKTINYRWKKSNHKVSYLYLVGNPLVWFSVVFAIILSTAMVISYFVFKMPITNRRYFYIISAFLSMYWAYMFVMFNIPRVMYLYHYFIPLFFGTFILFTLYNYIFEKELETNDRVLKIATILYIFEIIYLFWYFRVFDYFIPLTTQEFMQRVWFDFWKLKPIL